MVEVRKFRYWQRCQYMIFPKRFHFLMKWSRLACRRLDSWVSIKNPSSPQGRNSKKIERSVEVIFFFVFFLLKNCIKTWSPIKDCKESCERYLRKSLHEWPYDGSECKRYPLQQVKLFMTNVTYLSMGIIWVSSEQVLGGSFVPINSPRTWLVFL